MIRYFLADPDHELQRATAGASGFDLRYAGQAPMHFSGHECRPVPTGLHLELPHGVEAQVRPRGGLAVKYCITVLNTPGTVDSDYRGEVMVILMNHAPTTFVIAPGDRIAQLVFAPVYVGARLTNDLGTEDAFLQRVASLAELTKTARGEGRFGSTGRA